MTTTLRFGRSLMALACVSASPVACGAEAELALSGPIGRYDTTTPAGLPLRIEYCVPAGSTTTTPILIVVPGARRNADEYRDQWVDLATANGFVVLTLGASVEDFPTEYDYNAGGVTDAQGLLRPPRDRLFAAIEPVFEDFRLRSGSTRPGYALYGHSAGGGFVHRFVLMEPDARVEVAVAANPAFCAFPGTDWAYPFGVGGVAVGDAELRAWFAKPLTLLLGDRDLSPRTKPLSSGAEALRQGPHVYARGLGFFQAALGEAKRLGVPLRWKLEVVPDVGHSNTHMASHAAKQLLRPAR